MIKKAAVFVMITIFMIAFLPVMSMALMDLDADPTPVVSSGSFICKTWGGTTMDSFSVGGGSLAAASFSRTRGSVIYNLSGSCSEGDTLSLDISGSQWDMSKSSVGLDNNQINMSIRYLSSAGKDISEPLKYASGESKAASLSGSLSGTVPAGAVQVVVSGSFACTWSSAYSKATETVGINAIFSVGSDSVPILTKPTATTGPTQNPTPAPEPEANTDEYWYNKYDKSRGSEYWDLKGGSITVVDISGEVNMKRYNDDEDSFVYVEVGMKLTHGDEIKVFPKSEVMLQYPDLTTVVVKADSTIVYDDPRELSHPLVRHVAGNIWVNLKKMVKDGTMEVEMAQAVAGIKGTIIATRVSDQGDEIYLFTSSATVTSKITDKIINLKPGQMALVDESGEIHVSDFDIEAEAVKLGIPMSDLKADGYGNNSRLIWIILIVVFTFMAIIVALLLRKNKMKTMTAQSTTGIPASPHGQANPASTPRKTYCPNCGNLINDSQRFCRHCGKET